MPRSAPKRSARETVVTLRLPRELHEELKKEAEGAGRGFAAEVRRRLEASSAGLANAPDEHTRELLQAISAMAGALSQIDDEAIRVPIFRQALGLLFDAMHPQRPKRTRLQQATMAKYIPALAAYGLSSVGIAKSSRRFETYFNLIQRAEAMQETEDWSRERKVEEKP